MTTSRQVDRCSATLSCFYMQNDLSEKITMHYSAQEAKIDNSAVDDASSFSVSYAVASSDIRFLKGATIIRILLVDSSVAKR